MAVISNKREIVREDVVKWIKNLLIFSSGSIIVFLVVLQQGGTFQQAGVALYGALVNALIDLFRKWEGETKYIGHQVTKVSDPLN